MGRLVDSKRAEEETRPQERAQDLTLQRAAEEERLGGSSLAATGDAGLCAAEARAAACDMELVERDGSLTLQRAAEEEQLSGLSVVAAGDAGLRAAEARAAACGMELVERDGCLVLVADDMALTADLSELLARLRPDRLSRELLVRAARLRGVGDRTPVAVDATAGLGEDALLLAAAGFETLLYERDPVVAALLSDGLRRARDDARLASVAARMRLAGADSVSGMRTLAAEGKHVDVVLLDPMFPAKRKDAATRKKLQLIQRLEEPSTDADGEALLAAAFELRPRKVIVKRPLKGPFLAGRKPSYDLRGKVVRYDVYV